MMKKITHLLFKNNLLLCGLFFFLFFLGSKTSTAQQSYKYLRFTVDQLSDNNGAITNPGIHIDKIRWKMGNEVFPLTDLHSFIADSDSKQSENDEIHFTSSFRNFGNPPYKVFEDDNFSTYFTKFRVENEVIVETQLPATFTLEFKKAPIYPTGVELSIVHGTVTNFHCEGSNDGSNWTLLYTSPTLDFHSFTGAGRDYSASFSNTVAGGVDTQGPSAPSGLSVSNVTSIAADINWNASSDSGVGFLFYEIYLDGVLWQTSTTNSATVYDLSKGTNYNVQVKAVDAYGNKSVNNTTSINTASSYPEAIRKIDVGTGVGLSYGTNNSAGAGIYKSSANFGGDWTSQSESAGPFTQAFINDMKKFNHIRFMDIVGTNFNKIVNWTDRIQANNPNQRVPYHGKYEIINTDVMAYEWAIYLCNVTNKNMWINVPAEANENFVRELAKLIKNNLNDGLKVYVENSNETWNSGFPAFNAYKTKGEALSFGANSSHKYMVYKSLRVFKWFKEEFTTEQSRIITVLSGQLGSVHVSINHLSALKETTVYPNNVQINPDNVMPDFYALAPYFDLAGVEGEDGYTRMKKSIEEKIVLTQQHYNIWNPESIPLTTYEGGIHMNNALRSTFSLDKGIYNAYLYYLDKLSPYYAVFTHYSYVFGSNRNNIFGAVDYVGQPQSETPKLRGLLDWIEANKNNVDVNQPVIFENPKDISVPNGVSKVSFSIATLDPPQGYQWFKNNTIINGETTSVYTSGTVKLSDNGSQYKASATNSFGTATSTAATLTVTNHHLDISKATTAPTIDGSVDGMWSSISSQNIANANKGTTSGNADLSGNFKIAWDTNNVYLLVQVTDDVKVKDASGTNPKKYDFDGIEIYFNDDNAYTEVYNNDAQYVYNWEGGIHAFSGNKPTAGINVAQTNTANGYIMELAIPWSNIDVTAQNGNFIGFDIMLLDNDVAGSAEAKEKKAWHTLINESWKNPKEFASVKLTDGTSSGTAPTITSQPTNVSVGAGGNATFSVTASGSGLTYQWYKGTSVTNGVALLGATNNSIAFNNISTSHVGSYYVVVSNADGSVTSTIVTLSLDNQGTDAIVSVTSPPEVTIGETVSVSVNYTATATRKIYFELKASDNSQFPVFMNNTVAAGSGTSTFTFTVPSHVNLAKDHLFVTYISEENTVISPWQDRFDYEFVPVTVNDEGQSTTGYRYLKLTVTDYNNFSIREMDWVTASGSVPAGAMTSNNSIGVIASNTEGWNNAFAVFDEVYDNNGYWVGNGTTPKYVTIDLGTNSATPTAVKIYKSGWATLNSFKAEGTNDLNGNWDLLLSETNANGAFTTSSTAANVVEATFNFSATKSNQSKNNFEGVRVYPNPVTNYLNVNLPREINGSLTMSLTSIAGKVVWKKEINSSDSNNQIDVSRLASGLYFLELNDNLNTHQYKIIKN